MFEWTVVWVADTYEEAAKVCEKIRQETDEWSCIIRDGLNVNYCVEFDDKSPFKFNPEWLPVKLSEKDLRKLDWYFNVKHLGTYFL